MKILSDFIYEKLKVSRYSELGMDIFNSISNKNFSDNTTEFLNILPKLSKEITNDLEYFANDNSDNLYIVICPGVHSIIFIGKKNDDHSYIVTYNTNFRKVQIVKLTNNISPFVSKDSQVEKCVFVAPKELNGFFEYCRINAE